MSYLVVRIVRAPQVGRILQDNQVFLFVQAFLEVLVYRSRLKQKKQE